MVAELASPYLPPRLAEEHLTAIEGLWLRREHETRALLPTTFDSVAWSAEIEARLHALELRREEAIREASLRLASPLHSEVFAAAYCLLRLAPEQCVTSDGRVLLRSQRPRAVCEAVGLVAEPKLPWPGDDIALEGHSMRRSIPDGVLLASLASPSPRAGLIAAARRAPLPAFAKETIMRLAVGDCGEQLLAHRPLALYAWGVSQARVEGGADPAFAGLVDVMLGDSIFERVPRHGEAGVDPLANLHVLALLGDAATSGRIARRIRMVGPTLDLVFALGLLGIPRDAPLLVEALSAGDASLKREALRALAMVTGRWFVEGGLTDGRREVDGLALDVDGAHRFLIGWTERASMARHHLGRLLRSDDVDAPPSFRLLKGLLAGEPVVALPGLLDGRPRRAWYQPVLSLPAMGLESGLKKVDRISFAHMPKGAFRSSVGEVDRA
jgi:hypothetical protein